MFKESNFQSKRDLIGQCLLSLTENWASPWIAFANCTLKLSSRNKISPLVYKNESCLWARKLKQVFVHGRRVQIYLKRETCQTFAFNSSRITHPKCLPCPTFLRKNRSSLKLFTPKQTDTGSRAAPRGQLDSLELPGNSEFPSLWAQWELCSALCILTSLGRHSEIPALLSPALLNNRLQSHLLPLN